MNNHTDLLNHLAAEIGAMSYLEIGVSNRQTNFDKINVRFKIGVDPNPAAQANYQGTSDEFFKINVLKYDLIFIDGLHHADQVKRDFENSLAALQPGGRILIHDTNPESELLTHVPRDKAGRWLGDVYKFASTLREYAGIDFRTVDFDNGCTVVWRDPGFVGALSDSPVINWDSFQCNWKRWLRLIAPSEISTLFSQDLVNSEKPHDYGRRPFKHRQAR
ncbi:MAG TPA: class I SAM-dependent methyltransferase [Flavitalea sp.]|nr:class I SAM-dependent methyltransferase [Flavitalea sp.]